MRKTRLIPFSQKARKAEFSFNMFFKKNTTLHHKNELLSRDLTQGVRWTFTLSSIEVKCEKCGPHVHVYDSRFSH